MDWKSEAIDKLQQYRVKQNALKSIPVEISEIDSNIACIKKNSQEIGNETSGQEDMLLNCIARKGELQRNFQNAQVWVNIVDNALETLEENERDILSRLYISKKRITEEYLAEECCVTARTIRRWKDSALRNFTMSLYGFTES